MLHPRRAIPALATLAICLLGPFQGSAHAHGGTPIGRRFSLVPEVTGLDLGVGFAMAPDGSLFIAQKGGVVRVFRAGALLPTPFIDLSAEVNNTNDRGLLGIAVHPAFPAQPYVYLLYTYDPPQAQSGSGLSGPDGGGARVARLLRVTADASANFERELPGQRVVLVGGGSTWGNIGNPAGRNDYGRPSCGSRGSYARDCLPADELSHTIGTVAFGPDGKLYVGNGDGCDYTRQQSACTRALDLDSLAGKILRVDPLTGDAPSDNPFYDGDPQSNRSKVYQLGLRNPFRFAFDAASAQLYIGDVGWNTWEEINRAGPGANFGWPCYEGGDAQNLEQPQYHDLARCAELRNAGDLVTPSIHAYTHSGTSSSVQVGDVYRGGSYPPEYSGALFYSDYNKQELRTLHLDQSGNVLFSDTLASGIEGMTQISADPANGDMLIMRITTGTGGPSSVIDRLHYDPPVPGSLPSGVYNVLADYNGACVQAYPQTTRRVWFWTVTDPAYIQTAACADVVAQRFQLSDDGSGLYTLRSESQSDYVGLSGSQVVPVASLSAAMRFSLQIASTGYQLIDSASGNCLVTSSSATASGLALAGCADTAAQRFELLPYGNLPPTIAPIADQAGNVGDSVMLTPSASDPEGATLSFQAFGLPEGLTINSQTGAITGLLASSGSFVVTVEVSDGVSTASTVFGFDVVDDRVPFVTLAEPVAGTLYSPGDLVPFSGSAVDWQGFPLAPDALSWFMYEHHNQHVHVDGLPPTTGTSGSFVAGDHGDNTWLELCLVASDTQNRTAQACVELYPRSVDYMLDTNPSGLNLVWEGVSRTTPFTVTTHAGGVRDLSAPLAQSGYTFSSWSDGGAATHPITIGASPATFVATYTRVAPSPGSYALRATHSNKCVEYRPATYIWIFQTAPARFAQAPCSGAAAQQLSLQDNGDGSFRLIGSGGAVSVSGNSTADGASIVPASYSGASGQRFVVEPASSGYSLRNVGSNRCLAVQGASTADNASYVQVTCADAPSQHFLLE